MIRLQLRFFASAPPGSAGGVLVAHLRMGYKHRGGSPPYANKPFVVPAHRAAPQMAQGARGRRGGGISPSSCDHALMPPAKRGASERGARGSPEGGWIPPPGKIAARRGAGGVLTPHLVRAVAFSNCWGGGCPGGVLAMRPQRHAVWRGRAPRKRRA